MNRKIPSRVLKILLVLFTPLALLVSTLSFGGESTLTDDALKNEIFKNILERSFPYQAAIWFGPNATSREIAVCWESLDTSSPNDRDAVAKAVHDSWEINSKVRFRGWKKCAPNNRGVRIVVEDVAPDAGPHTTGLGNQIDGLPNGMSLDFRFANFSSAFCSAPDKRDHCIKAISVHEFGHALGFAHEQNRDDTPDWCKSTELAQGPNGDTIVTPWDSKSVMNYCYNMYTAADFQLSKLDIYTLQLYYGKPD